MTQISGAEGTAAGRSGEEKTGGPGGVLRCADAWPNLEPGLGVPCAAARPGDKTRDGGVNRSSPKQRKSSTATLGAAPHPSPAAAAVCPPRWR